MTLTVYLTVGVTFLFSAKIRKEILNKMAKKYDGVIEAVRYKNGQIVVVRAFERRGAAFSDRVMMDRKELLERLKDGRKFIVGKRKELLAGSFEEGKPVQVVSRDGKDFISTNAQSDRDELEQAPVF
jgi:uncharacterized protein YjhX (UPF0386 family)